MSDQAVYKRLYPDQESLVFDGGLDTKFPKSLLPENESTDCLNVEFVNGAVQTRQGSVRLNTTPAGSAPFDGLYTRRASDGASETMCAFIGGHMLTLGATTFNTVPSAQSVFTIGARVGAELSENYLFIGNGGVGPYKWDGSLFTQHGVYPPTQTMTAASATTGSLTTNGVYSYRYTNVNTALVESDLSPAVTFTCSGSALAIALSNIASGSTASMGINARRIYRTQNGGSSYFRVATLSDTSTVTYTDRIADTDLGSPAPTDNGLPPKYNAIIYHRNILFVNDASNPNYVWYSAIGQPYTFPSTNFFKVGDKAGDLVRGFASYDNYVVIFCEQSIWINYMPDPATPGGWRQLKTKSPYGSKSPYCYLQCSVRGEDMLLFPALQSRKFVGFGGLVGDTLEATATAQVATNIASDLQSQVIEPDMFQVQETYLNNITGIVYKNRAFITLTYQSPNTTNNRIYVWDFSLSNVNKRQIASWVPWKGINVQQFAVYSGKLYGASSTSNGYVYQVADTGVYSDDGSAIDSYYWTKEFPGFPEDTNYTKDFRYLNFLYDNSGSYQMTLRYRTDSDAGVGNYQNIDLTSGGSVWGSGVNGLTWGVGKWGGGVAQTEKRVFFGAALRGKRLQIRFDNQNTVNQRFAVYRAQFLYNIKGYR